MDLPTKTAADAAALSTLGLLCPACGYDLRGSASDRCSECGLVLDRADLGRSNFPWPYRKQRGGLRAFLLTVWRVTRDSPSLRHEVAKPQSVPDAVRFRLWVSMLVVLSSVTVVAAYLWLRGIVALALQKPDGFNMMTSPLVAEPYLADLAVPWAAGVTSEVGPFFYVILFAFYVVAAPARVLRAERATAGAADAVRAIACYVTAPLALLIGGGVGVALYLAIYHPDGDPPFRSPLIAAAIAGCAAGAVGLVATVFHVGQWRARVTHGGYATGFLGMGELLLRWVIGAAVFLGLVPWCLGFVRIVVDSFRF